MASRHNPEATYLISYTVVKFSDARLTGGRYLREMDIKTIIA
jgi:hypothetical protein